MRAITILVLLIGLVCSCCATLPVDVESVTPEPVAAPGVGPAFLAILGVIALIVTGVLASG